MACQRCGARMLTKVGGRGGLLVCSDCGTPVLPSGGGSLARPDSPLSVSVLLLGFTGFFLLIFTLTYGPRPQPELVGERRFIQKLTTGQFERRTELLERNPDSSGSSAVTR